MMYGILIICSDIVTLTEESAICSIYTIGFRSKCTRLTLVIIIIPLRK